MLLSVHDRATTFAVAHLQLMIEGKVPDAIAKQRLTICMQCDRYKDEIDGQPGSGHCRACGCPDWPISRMHRPGRLEPGKAWFPLACPLGRYPYHPGRRAPKES